MILRVAALILCIAPVIGQAAPPESGASVPNKVVVSSDEAGGLRLTVDGSDFMVFGMNWGYIPVGENYRYDLWTREEAFIKRVLDREMTLLKDMGVNAIRLFNTIPPKWVTYIHTNYGIFTAINHLAGRYGFVVDGALVNPVDYSNKATRAAIVADIAKTAARYKNVPGVLMYLIGNENNYGLVWKSFEIEALPAEEQNRAKAVHLYSLFGEAIAAIKAQDSGHPVAIVNGDLGYLDLVAKYCADMDIMGANVYRGSSSRDLFSKVRTVLKKPFLYTEFGSDAYNAKEGREDHLSQAQYLREQWQEIYEQSAGKGREGNAVGGFIFQWTDGWWKYKQETNLDVHDTNASWPNEGYPHDFVAGENNMNEEWFGIAAKGPNDDTGLFPVYPRSAYYLLAEAFRLDPYAASTTQARIRSHFGRLSPKSFAGAYERDRIAAKVGLLERFSITDARLRIETYTTGGARLQESERTEPRFDHMESLFLGVGVTPYAKLSGKVVVNVLGNVPNNRIDDIFFEKRGSPRSLIDSSGETFQLDGIERVKLYQAEFSWDEQWFGLEGYYRVGHFHWGYEGDFFGLYPEAHYLPDVDRYNANAPYGMVFEGRKALKGIKVAIGPELYWGANPQIIVKYQRKISDSFNFTLMHHEDIAGQSDIVSSAAIPTQLNRRSTFHLDFNFGPYRLELGGIVAGTPRLDDRFVASREADGGGYLNSGNDFFEDKIQWVDTLGGKAKLSMDFGAVKWFVQGAYKGLVADGGPDGVVTYSGFSLKEDGRGNQYNVLTGLTYNVGNFQIAPAVLFQKPLEDPLQGVGDYYNPGSGNYYEGIRPRNFRDDPFAVLGNRETIGFELILAWDPTPATWLWAWDNEIVEDAPFAGSLDFVYRMHRTIRDVNIGFNKFGPFAFPGSPPAQDVWDVKARLLFRLPHDVRLRTLLYAGQGEARGDDERLITRYGLDARLTVSRFALDAMLKFDDWGPYDFHKDFNLTYPVQLGLDASWGLVAPRWLGRLYGKFGVAFQFRTLDEHSPRFRTSAASNGNEWELRTYVDISL